MTATSAGPSDDAEHVHVDLLEQKRLADAIDKMCPMCAKMYTSNTSFDAFQVGWHSGLTFESSIILIQLLITCSFQEHVESHFIDDSEPDSSFERKFEMLSHTVGDF